MTILVVMAMLLGAGDGQAAGGQESGAQPATPKTARKELQRPTDWVTRTDTGAEPATPLYFVSMPPGWHITTGPGTILYNPANTCDGPCRIEAEIYLFPGQGEGGYGLFFSGLKLDAETGPTYDSLMLRWDGAVVRTHWIDGKRVAAPWLPHMAHYVQKGLPDKPVKNVITIDIVEKDGARVTHFRINGNQILNEHYMPNLPGHKPYDGIVGLRVDAGVNLHVTRLDVTAK